VAPYDSTVTKRIKQAGGILLGKTNLDEFAMGSSTENSAYKTTCNPWDLKRVPGGSSGGSAAAVAASLSTFSLGTDTGGSIRQPASFCGVFGLKPTYGRVPRYGIMAMASSLDQAGPMSFGARDSAEVLNVIAGYDPQDVTSSHKDVPDYTQFLDKDIKGLKIGLIKEFFAEGLSDPVRKRIEEAIALLKKAGAEIREITIPKAKYGLSIYYILMMAEVSSNLARYDGIRYGFCEKDASLIKQYKKTRGKTLGAEAKRRIILGTYVLSAGYKDAYYILAQKARSALRAEFEKAFEEVDILLGPVSPTVAFRVGEKMNDPVQMYLSDIYTVPVNPVGLPAASVPCGLVKVDGSDLPVSFQLIAPHFREDLIFQVASVYEKLNPDSIIKPNL
jgi:aspartyl-tRNA(Asn)/glutamyl-tRNA(Gln) amidotransferase subunit A